MEAFRLADFSRLAAAENIWLASDFKPWQNGTAFGLYRRVVIVKDGLLGEVARYLADDYIVLKYDESDISRLMRAAKPESELMTQRWLFLQESGENIFTRRSFWFGFKGGAEFYSYSLQSEARAEFADLAHLVNAAEKA